MNAVGVNVSAVFVSWLVFMLHYQRNIDGRVVRSNIRGEVELLTQVSFEIALPLLIQLHSAYIRDEEQALIVPSACRLSLLQLSTYLFERQRRGGQRLKVAEPR